MTTTQLTPAQHAILAKAIHTSGGKIDWFPDNIKGGARKKVLDGLFNRKLTEKIGDDWFVAAEGYDALGMTRPAATGAPENADASCVADTALDADVAACEAAWAKDQAAATPRTGKTSKHAAIVDRLLSPLGATMQDLMQLTGWQAHSVRGMLANLRGKHKLDLVSTKEAGVRTYRIIQGA